MKGKNMLYKVVRYFQNGERRTIKSGLYLEEAQEHCRDKETSSKTCTNKVKLRHYANSKKGEWFDGYIEDK
jgi:hypothetical protein